jgi:hypothetical protein
MITHPWSLHLFRQMYHRYFYRACCHISRPMTLFQANDPSVRSSKRLSPHSHSGLRERNLFVEEFFRWLSKPVPPLTTSSVFLASAFFEDAFPDSLTPCEMRDLWPGNSPCWDLQLIVCRAQLGQMFPGASPGIGCILSFQDS